jgi:NADH:ubiquinone oxidoreductase subunit 6 (subunit J)
MRLSAAIRSGLINAFRTWKGIIIVWLFSLILISLAALPGRSILYSGLGKSMVTERLTGALNFEILGDLGKTLTSFIFSSYSGLILVILFSILLNALLTGGLFDSLKAGSGRISGGGFFRASAGNFWSFLIITLIISLIILVIFVLLVVIPMAVVGNSEVRAEGSLIRTGMIVLPLFFLLATVLLLVADYSRAWKVRDARRGSFRAIGYGFSQTFKTFFPSLAVMLVLLVFQCLFAWAVMKVLVSFKPETGTGVLLLFLLSQFFFLLRILLKTWRYGAVTALMEQALPAEPAREE